jgi:uncharacterized protein DUF6851/vanadium-dependent haloperoxidase-like protein
MVAIAIVSTFLVRQVATAPQCPSVADHPEWTVARRWDEALLDAIRRSVPAPTVHARNLFHTSAAMWDAWAAYDPNALGYFVNEKHTASDVAAARNEAISYAAYRVLTNRYINSVGADESLSEFDDLMDALCYPLDNTSMQGDSPAAVGNRIAAAVIAFGMSDGSNQSGGYADPDYAPANPPLVVAQSGTTLVDPNRWQPLQLEHMISQNGIPVVNGVQQFVGSNWGGVKGFALPAAGRDRLPLDPGPPPRYGDPAYASEAEVVIADSAALDTADGVSIDISPGAYGNSTLGTNDGHGRNLNPVTGQAYAPDVVNRGDFTRSLAEFWADGPNSETPPGHWNVIANTVSDQMQDHKIGGTGAAIDRLEWDVKLYFALNAAVHDAAIAAWGAKGHYDSIRPISMIRFLGDNGQLPLQSGLVQLDSDGQNLIRAWHPGGGVGWVRAADWVPYQAPTFVTPSFAGYFSGHSTFSRAAAEVLTGLTGSDYFPGGLGSWEIKSGSLKFEEGPATDVVLQWATYYDAADQAGISRLYGGIHVPSDDFTGRIVGSQCGKAAWALVQHYFSP